MGRDELTYPLPFPHQGPKKTWRDAATKWHRAGLSKSPRTLEEEARVLAYFTDRLQLELLDQISRQRVDDLLDELLGSGRKPATINRMLGVLRAVLNAAVAWQWIAYAPRIPHLREPPRRVRWLTPSEAKRLMRHLPPHLQDLVAFSLETGLRRSNVTGLTWQQVDVDRRVAWIHPDQAKGRRAIAVPLSPIAQEILRRRRDSHPTYVFTYKGRRLHQVNTRAWRQALDRAGIEGFRWHDLRHTWASWHAQAGTPLHVLQELGGWRSARMVQVYAHLSTAHLQEYVDKLHRYLSRRQ